MEDCLKCQISTFCKYRQNQKNKSVLKQRIPSFSNAFSFNLCLFSHFSFKSDSQSQAHASDGKLLESSRNKSKTVFHILYNLLTIHCN